MKLQDGLERTHEGPVVDDELVVHKDAIASTLAAAFERDNKVRFCGCGVKAAEAARDLLPGWLKRSIMASTSSAKLDQPTPLRLICWDDLLRCGLAGDVSVFRKPQRSGQGLRQVFG